MGVLTWFFRRRKGACPHVWQGRDGVWRFIYRAEIRDGGRVMKCLICGAETDTAE